MSMLQQLVVFLLLLLLLLLVAVVLKYNTRSQAYLWHVHTR
jgi:hypothetical protein